MEQMRVVSVDINGQRYPIRTQLDAKYVAELASYVEQKMALAQRECPQGDSLKIAVLAALNIADECFRARDEDAACRASVIHRAEELERMLDLALAPANDDDRLDSPLARTAGSF
jgi:cell division protein ZapA